MTVESGNAPPHAHSLQEDIARCVHCGFCLQACPTYVQLGMETDSPRGRIALVDALTSGRAAPSAALLSHLDLCLQCRACETACPSSVPYGRIIETARAGVMADGTAPRSWRLRAFALRQLLPHRRRLEVAMMLLRLYRALPLAWVIRRTGVLRRVSPSLAAAEAAMPAVPRTPFRPPEQPAGLTRTVAMLTGCVMPHLYPRTHDATVRVLNRLGYRVIFPESTCCGALSLHAGDRRFAQKLARRTIDAFLKERVDAIIVNSAGCGSTMKEYADLLSGDARYRDKAARLAALTKDVLEFVAAHDLPAVHEVPLAVTYQDSCHLAHAQRISAAPRLLLRAIPGLELREMAAPDRCCGSAGVYNLVQRDMSERLLASKMDDVAGTGATCIATANPGCMMQLESGVRQRGLRAEVVHVIELLDRAMADRPS
jgi:glycolate oxidase iron-sulfur subunit